MTLEEKIAQVKENIARAAREAGRDPAEITLVAATKVQTSDTIRQAIAGGVTICGENRVQEMTAHLDDDAYAGAALHFIGHLQTNKVKQVVGKVDLIQSVDRLELLECIEKTAARLDLVQDILLEVNIGQEESKSGFTPDEAMETASKMAQYPHCRLLGLMAIPPISEEPGGNSKYFAQMRQLLVDIRAKKYDNVSMTCLSMGMSGDYADAIANGSTMIRVGTAIFGPRNYGQPQK